MTDVDQTPTSDRVPRLGSPNRRQVLLGGLGAAAVLGLAACTNQSNSSAAPPAPTGDPNASPTGDAFPVTVTHKYGTTTIESRPSRIIALGQTDVDPIVALGYVPIGVGSFSGDWYDPIFPWNEAAFGGTRPEMVNFEELQFEEIAALQPDLITGVLSGLTENDYTKLSKICPVVAQHADYADYAVPYGPQTQLIGEALGESAKATQLVQALDDQYASVRSENPTWASQQAVCAEFWDGSFDVLGETAPRTSFLTGCGFQLSPELNALVGDAYNAELSAEQLSLVGALDLVVWTTSEGGVDKLKSQKIVAGLPTTKEGRSLWLTDAMEDSLLWAMDWGTVLSGPYAIENGVPQIQAALGQG